MVKVPGEIDPGVDTGEHFGKPGVRTPGLDPAFVKDGPSRRDPDQASAHLPGETVDCSRMVLRDRDLDRESAAQVPCEGPDAAWTL